MGVTGPAMVPSVGIHLFKFDSHSYTQAIFGEAVEEEKVKKRPKERGKERETEKEYDRCIS